MNKTEIENQIQQIKDELRIIEPMMIEDDDKDVKDRIKTLYSELNDLNEKADTISPDEEDEREMRREQEIEDNIEIKDSKNKRFYKQGGSVYSSDSKTKINAEELISLANSSTPYDTENSGRGEITDIEGAISILKNKYPEYQDLEVSDFYEEEDNSLNEDYEESKESGFPKNSDNITKDELHEHFDLDNDGKVTLDEYAQHINYHCDNPETLDEELEQSDYDKGFKYKKGGNINESLSSEEKELLMMASLVVLKEPNTSYFDDSRKQKLLDLTSKLRENYAWGGFIIGGLLGGYAGYKYGLTQTKRKFNNLFKEEEKFVSDLKKRGEKMEKEGKKEKEKLKKEKRKVKESDYEDIFKEGGDLDANGFDTETNIKSNQEEILELKEFLKTATDKEDIEQAKLSIEELENEIMYNYGLGGYMIAGGVGAYYGAKNPKAVRKVTDPIDKAVSDIGKNLTDKKFEKGGQIDYFEQYELLEKEYPKIYEVVFEQGELTDYKETERLLNKLNSMGWTFDYGLDNSPYDLRPFAPKVNMPNYAKGGEVDSWEYKWGGHEANISKHPRREQYRWYVSVNDGYDSSTDLYNDIDIELETPLEAENNMFRNINDRIGNTPERQISTYEKGGETASPITNYKKNIMGTLSFDLKVKGMRKPQDFIVYPITEKTDKIRIQSDKKFGEIHLPTGNGVLSKSGNTSWHLASDMMNRNINKFELSESEMKELKDKIKATTGKSVGSSFVKSDNSGAELLAEGGKLDMGEVDIYEGVDGDCTVVMHGDVFEMNQHTMPNMSIDMYSGSRSEYPADISHWGKKIDFKDAPIVIKDKVEARTEEFKKGGKLKEANRKWSHRMWFTNSSPDDEYYYENNVIDYLVENPSTFKLTVNRRKLNDHNTLMGVYKDMGIEPGSTYLNPKDIKDYAIKNNRYEWLKIEGDRGSEVRERVIKKYVDRINEYSDYSEGFDAKELLEQIQILESMAFEEKDEEVRDELRNEANKMRTQL